jgi:hypothetical protein
MMGFHTDSHTGPVPEPVWDLLERVVPFAKNLRGVTFEFHESSYGLLGEGGNPGADRSCARGPGEAHRCRSRHFNTPLLS